MGLDVYVGTLTRYYSGDWELTTQKVAREIGLELAVVRQHDPEDAIRDPGEIFPTVVAWRDSLNQSLVAELDQPLDWNEDTASPYFTDKPAWDCYGSLLLWAAYAENPQLPRPTSFVEDWGEDPAYSRSAGDAFPSRYNQLLNVELWLPCPFQFVFEAADMAGPTMRIGSSLELLWQLDELNRQTWQADDATLAQWRRDGAEYASPLELGARFAFAVMRDLAKASVAHRLPMRLD